METFGLRKCLKCGYEWTARVKEPRECPRCKRHMMSEMSEAELADIVECNPDV